MLKIMIADDEGIVIEALKFIIENNFTEPYMIECAKTGRQVIELAERYRPDVAFMDIQMPGISGIKAMQEIRKTNQNTIFIIISAYEKFDYAKDAIGIGVLDYLNKPIVKERVIEVLNKAAQLVHEKQKKRADELEIQEKLETVLPVIENGMIYAILFQQDFSEEIVNYRTLLGLETDCGYMMVIRFGESVKSGKLTNVIGTSVKSQPFSESIRETIKEYTGGVVGAMMGNNVIVFVPKAEESPEEEYDARILIIDRMCGMVRNLKQSVGGEYRVGIGTIRKAEELGESYHEALEALRVSTDTVAHAKDLPIGCQYEQDYPVDVEKKIFASVENGDRVSATEAAKVFFEWMENNAAGHESDVRLKVLEFALYAERIAYESGGMTYRFLSRHTYLDEVSEDVSFPELKRWFLEKIGIAAENVQAKKKESAHSIVDKAKEYILSHYKDASLDSISRAFDISPYYFSKLFKEKTGENFIDYLTDFKIERAKELLKENRKSMKEICIDIGYANPNYFSYIFKKKVGVTPSEYREGINI
ncbi:MAG: response regulator [Lachnospiraceae bacterium]|nr:response regulator [Lachnospiraceae bacterium]